jgi:uncharacterized membrane protein
LSGPPITPSRGRSGAPGALQHHRRFSWAHGAYIVAIVWKGFDGLLETGGGAIIGLFGPEGLSRFIQVTAPELESHVRTAIFLQHSVVTLSQTYRFVTAYLLIHGILKLGLALALLRERHVWIFPLAMVLLSGFVAYMAFRLTVHWSYWLSAFAIFDVITIGLVVWEWRGRLRALRAAGLPVL